VNGRNLPTLARVYALLSSCRQNKIHSAKQTPDTAVTELHHNPAPHQSYLSSSSLMLVAIRRVIPTARQRLARPHRLGASVSPRFNLTAPVRCLSQTPALRTSGDASRPADPATATARSVEGPGVATEEKEGAAGEPVDVTEGESTFAPEVSHEEMASGVMAASESSEATDDRLPARRGRPVGSKTRTTVRKPVVIPMPVLPEWFIDRIVLREDHGKGSNVSLLRIHSDPPKAASEAEGKPPPSETVVDVEAPVEDTPPPEANVEIEAGAGEEAPIPGAAASTEPTTGGPPNPEAASATGAVASAAGSESTTGETAAIEKGSVKVGSGTEAMPKERYRLHESVWKEISAYVQTGLLLPKGAFADGVAATKSHCILHLPKEGGLYYLDAVTEKVAAEVGADLIRIDAQDFAEIAGDFLGDSRHGAYLYSGIILNRYLIAIQLLNQIYRLLESARWHMIHKSLSTVLQ